MLPLQTSGLDLVKKDVLLPGYDREALGFGIIHFGIGAFHRAHQAVYTDDAIAVAGGNWGIVGVSLRSDAVAKTLRPQDCLFSVLSEDTDSSELRVVGAVKELLVAQDNPMAVAKRIAEPAIKIITLTITEKGYCLAQDGCSLDTNNQSITADLLQPKMPSSAVGLLALGLHLRFSSGGSPITIISCDNLAENSRRLESVLRDYLSQCFPEVIEWMAQAVFFPCSMIDRIVPAANKTTVKRQSNRLGLHDEAAVTTEQFRQWVIEDNFAAERPAWDRVGVQLVDSVVPFEALKLGLLNASHTAIAISGLLLELDTVDQVMADNTIASFIDDLMNEELMSALTMPGDFDMGMYRDQLLQRFRNPHLKHRCAQIAMDSSEKISQRWLPAFAANSKTDKLTQMLSAWCYLVLRTDIAIEDPRQTELLSLRASNAALASKIDSVLACARLTPETVPHIATMNANIVTAIDEIAQIGLRSYLGGGQKS